MFLLPCRSSALIHSAFQLLIFNMSAETWEALCSFHISLSPECYFCADAIHWFIQPPGPHLTINPSDNMTDYNMKSADMGAAMAYAMTYAYQASVSTPVP